MLEEKRSEPSQRKQGISNDLISVRNLLLWHWLILSACRSAATADDDDEQTIMEADRDKQGEKNPTGIISSFEADTLGHDSDSNSHLV